MKDIHCYDVRCGCQDCVNHELALTRTIRQEKDSFFQARRNTRVWSSAPSYYDANYTNRVTKAQG